MIYRRNIEIVPKCLIIEDMHPSIISGMKKLGYHCDYFPDIKPEEVYHIIHRYTGLFIRSKMQIEKKLIRKATSLRFIARAGSGMDIIDTKVAKRKKIVLINSPEGNKNAVGEHCLGLLLCLLNKMYQGDNQIKKGIWKREENRGVELKGKTVAIIGYGTMGMSFAQKLKSMDCKVLCYDKYRKNYSDNFAEESGWNEIFKKADILSLHVPLTPKTENLINTVCINRFKKNIWLINTSRGKVVSIADLIKGLKEKKIKGAALDVLENENINNLLPEKLKEFKTLCNFSNVLLTPHVAGWTFESYQRINEVLIEKIKKHIRSGLLPGQI